MSVQVFLGEPPAHIKQWIIEHYTPPTPAVEPLCFTAVGSDMTVKYGNDYDYVDGMQQAGINFQYSTDGKNWTEWVLGETQFDPISIPVGTKLYLRGNNPNGVYSPNGPADEHFTFTGSGTINASGNIQSLIDPTMERTDVPRFCYIKMFSGCSSLTSAPALPATTLADNCYASMFNGCSNLTQAPALPATTLASRCYFYMFSGCTNLAQAPALPATTLADRCYQNMFSGCSSLTQAPALPATTLANNCYNYMFSDCSSLTKAPALPATTLANSCYVYMFNSCTKVTELHYPASIQNDSAFTGMNGTPWFGATNATIHYDL